jgi:transposase-like protein
MEPAAECMLVLIGATPEGKKELVSFQTGVRESTQSWRELLIDINQRGLEIAPDLAVGDGALGFWKAIEQVFPGTRHQLCGNKLGGCESADHPKLPARPRESPVFGRLFGSGFASLGV